MEIVDAVINILDVGRDSRDKLRLGIVGLKFVPTEVRKAVNNVL